MIAPWLPLMMFALLLTLLLLGVPVFLSLCGSALLFAIVGWYGELFFLSDLGFVPSRIFGIMQNTTLLAVPLFILMGYILDRAKITESMLSGIASLAGRNRILLPLGVLGIGVLMAASTGIVGATVVTMGVISLPQLLQHGYSKKFSAGLVASSGTLGQIIPPSIVLILLGDMMNLDVGDLFLGAALPGLVLVGLFACYICAVNIKKPSSIQSQPLAKTEFKIGAFLLALIPPIVLIGVVLGSIIFGMASPTEAASCGVICAIALAGIRKNLKFSLLREAGQETINVTSMVFFILIGAQFFGIVFRGLGGDFMIEDWAAQIGNSNAALPLFFMIFGIFILGFFLDFLEICFIVIPILMPFFREMQVDMLWIAILIALVLQTSFLTPPFGFSLFYLKGVAPKSIGTGAIYRGIIPFAILQIIAVVILCFFPQLATWLPRLVF